MSTGENLKRLATTFTVCDIMVPTAELTWASSDSEAPSKSAQNPEFSTIPIREGMEFTRYYSRDSRLVSAIRLQDLIGDGTRLLDLVDVLAEREFSFILGPNGITGYVHYSDLNHSLVKLAYYMLLEGLERYCLNAVKHFLEDKFLEEALGQPRFVQVQRKYRKSGDAGRSTANYLNVADILRLALRAEAIELDEVTIISIKHVRNCASHAPANLVSDHAGVKRLAMVKRECFRMLAVR